MELTSETIAQRLSLVGNSTGSVIGVASWWAIHAPETVKIAAVWETMIVSPDTVVEKRCALLYVAHELLLACLGNACPEKGKRAILTSIGKAAPGAIKQASALPDPDSHFVQTVDQVLKWWSGLNIFQADWINEVRRASRKRTVPDATSSESREFTGTASHGELAKIVRLHRNYLLAKEKLSKVGNNDPEVGEVKEELVRRLTALVKAVGEDEDSLLNQWNEELTALKSGTSAQPTMEEDVLGSFFD